MLIGQPIERLDGRLKVTGQARYAAEFAPAGLVHAVLVQSTIAAGSVTGFDLAAAQGMPGVLAIITAGAAPRLPGAAPGAAGHIISAPLLQDTAVYFNGQHIAVVVADTIERAQAAAETVQPRYQHGEALTDMAAALHDAYPPQRFRDGARPPDSSRGDPDGAFAAAPVQLTATYTTPIEHHNPMEPHATIAAWQGERLTLWTATQGIDAARTTLATLFAIPPDNVTVLCPYVGGGFGSKGSTWPPAALAAMAARQVGRPVSLVLTRRQMYTSNGYRPRTIQTLRLAAAADGALLSLRHDGISQTSPPVLGEFTEAVALGSEMLYACPNLAVTHRVVAVNASLPTFMRAPGEASGSFALESAMDELAAALRLDPLALRLRNYAERDAHADKPFASKRLRACYAAGAEAFGWQHRPLAPRTLRDGQWLIGMGMATATYPTNRQPAAALVRIMADGSALAASATHDLGTGTYTVMAQVAAEELGLPIGRVRFLLGDSRLPPAPVSGGSQTVASVGPAVQAAARALRDKVFALALADPHGRFRGTTPAELRLADGVVSGHGVSVPVGALLAAADLAFLEATAAVAPGAEKQAYAMHSFGAQFAEVRIDGETGELRLSRLVGAFDTGRILNARTARSQLLGGMVYGIGMALLEETLVDAETGRIANANLSDYLVPVHADVPRIEVLTLDGDDGISNPLGAKGIGELPTVGVAAAIANAVWHATGVRVRDLPITLEKLMA